MIRNDYCRVDKIGTGAMLFRLVLLPRGSDWYWCYVNQIGTITTWIILVLVLRASDWYYYYADQIGTITASLQTNQEEKVKFNWHYCSDFVTPLLI